MSKNPQQSARLCCLCTHQVVHPEEVVVDVHVVALEPPDDLPEAGQLVHDGGQAGRAPAPSHHHAPVHLGR